MHGPQLLITTIVINLLSQVCSSFVVERNHSTYNFILSIKMNRLTFRRVEKPVAVHSVLHLVLQDASVRVERNSMVGCRLRRANTD